MNKASHLFYLIIFLFFLGCNNKEYKEAFCEISFAVQTDEFYQGCMLPISVHAGEGTNTQTQVQLFING